MLNYQLLVNIRIHFQIFKFSIFLPNLSYALLDLIFNKRVAYHFSGTYGIQNADVWHQSDADAFAGDVFLSAIQASQQL